MEISSKVRSIFFKVELFFLFQGLLISLLQQGPVCHKDFQGSQLQVVLFVSEDFLYYWKI